MASPESRGGRPRNPEKRGEVLVKTEHGLSPSPEIIDALRGTISEPVTTVSQRSGKEVTVRLVTEGSGQFGLTDMKDNKTWAGISNRSVLSARYAVNLAGKVLYAANQGRISIPEEQAPNTQTLLDAMLLSTAGRRTWDEARWYPDAVEDAEEKLRISNKTLGLRLLQEKNIPQSAPEAFELVAALAHNPEEVTIDPTVKESWTHRIASYVDSRTTGKWQPLPRRMGDFLISNFFDKGTVTEEVKKTVYDGLELLIDHKKGLVINALENDNNEPENNITVESADKFAGILGAREGSARLARKDFMQLVLQNAETEALLQHSGIDTENVTDETVPMPQWEKDLRREYVRAAKREITDRIRVLHRKHLSGDKDALPMINKEFSPNNWWGKIARDIYIQAA